MSPLMKEVWAQATAPGQKSYFYKQYYFYFCTCFYFYAPLYKSLGIEGNKFDWVKLKGTFVIKE